MEEGIFKMDSEAEAEEEVMDTLGMIGEITGIQVITIIIKVIGIIVGISAMHANNTGT